MDAKRLVALDTFEGFRCDVNKQMSPSMLVMHSFALSPASAASSSPMQGGPPPPPPSSYTFITQVGDDSGGIFVSRVDTARGGVDARMHRPLLGGLALLKLQMSLSGSENDTLLAEVDVGTAIPILTWTANLKYGSMGGGPVWGANYWQAITPNFLMGGEGMYIAAQGTPAAAYAFKYKFQAPLTPQEQEQVEAEKNKSGAAAPPPGPPGMPPPEAPGASSIIGQFHSNGMMTLNYRRVVTPQRVTVGSELAFPFFAPFNDPPDLLLGAEFNLTPNWRGPWIAILGSLILFWKPSWACLLWHLDLPCPPLSIISTRTSNLGIPSTLTANQVVLRGNFATYIYTLTSTSFMLQCQ